MFYRGNMSLHGRGHLARSSALSLVPAMARGCALLIAIAPFTMEAHQRRVVDLGSPFTLKVAEQVALRGTTLVIGFERVLSDSRCPEGVQCITAGDVAVSLWVQEPGRKKTKLELRAGESPSATFHRRVIRLLDVQPRPGENRKLSPRDYLVRLRVDDVQRG